MSLQRLKFAHARGARLQWQDRDGRWYEYDTFEYGNVVGWSWDHRIHPHDAHLEYGPVSSELRRRAIESDFEGVDVDWRECILKLPVWLGVWVHFDYVDEVHLAANASGRMHMLFVAELLADEGL